MLTKRERYIGGGVIAVLAIFMLDHYVLTPMVTRRNQIEAERSDCVRKLEHAQQLLAKKRRLGGKWNEMMAAGLAADASAAESKLLHSIRDWAQEAGLSLSAVKPERSEIEQQFQKITFRASGNGPMSAVSKFLWQVQTSTIPVRIADLQLISRKEGMDDLTLQISVSTLCKSAKAEGPAPSAASSATASDAGALKDPKELDP